MAELKESRNMNLSREIRNTIVSGKKGKLFFTSSFSHIRNVPLVTRVLSRLEKEGLLVRLSKGVYLYPETTGFGIVRPTLDEIAKAIADKDSARIMPTGSIALNRLGLSEQVPLNVVYQTSGSSRVVKVGTRKIRFKHSAPRNFAYKSQTMPLIAEALKGLKEKNVNDTVIGRIEKIILSLNSKELELFKNDLVYVPVWIRTILQTVLQRRHS